MMFSALNHQCFLSHNIRVQLFTSLTIYVHWLSTCLFTLSIIYLHVKSDLYIACASIFRICISK